MSLFSFFRKNKQEAPDDGASYPRAKDEPNPKRPRARRKSSDDDEAGDPVLPEKKRARRRLIGAVALVLAAVIGLPMVLDSEPRPVAQDIEITIPSKDPARQPRRLPAAAALDPAEQIIEPVDETVTGKVAAVAAVANQVSGTPASVAPASTPKPAEATPAADAKSTQAQVAPKVETKPAAKAEAQVAARAESKPLANEGKDAARARAILEGKQTAEADKPQSDKKTGKFMLQVAALTSQEKITELRNKLKSAGIASQTQKVPTAGGERTRVRVGPFASKEEAEKMRARLVKLGLNGSLVPLGE
ncbi:SPOR domain-containing protein [Janthinobacterium sp. 17J80-10]|uniref:SPOR domain-containing protein n=1 Tax=Janthinobacterium sp. 17J80-10 TaxID=2497863 RepID=UPI00100565F6|nr:SPOR domain-containing protein [Janthinobacterium sp. 17J80-10]QAU34728.1 hypothetical protein EKL02_11330 [Janthinobacterium sp. 17J80-10]